MKTAERDALENGDIIDTAKKGSLSIYKYDMTAAQAAEEGLVCGGTIQVFLEVL